MMEPALFVGEIDDVNLTQLPSSGEEYIKRVILEAQQCANVVVADIGDIYKKTSSIPIEPSAGSTVPSFHFTPTLEWQQCQVSDFANVRLFVSQLKNEIQTLKRKWTPPKIDLPSIDDQDGWINFCTGTDSKGYLIQSPMLNTIFCLSHPTIEQVLEYLVECLESSGKIKHGLGQWLYALLVVLELPLNPDACSCLRSLARTCSVIRSNSKLEVHEIGALNLLICLVARYFRQLDLADP